MTSVAIYLRVSSAAQTTASQLPDLQAWARSQTAPVVWYEDRFTGTSMNRPGFDRLMADARARKISRIVVWRIDRLGRTCKGLLNLLDELQQLGVGLLSIRESFDVATPMGRMVLTILAAFAEFETEVRFERQTAGIAAAKAAGVKWGGRKPGTRIKVTLEVESFVRDEAARGTSIAKIARLAGLSRKTIYRVLDSDD